MPKISVILPSLNVKNYIENAIRSVIDQSLKDLEIICVDAGSTDGTVEIIKHFAEIDSRVRIIFSNVKSYGYQMNMAISEANGEYISIVETDDYISVDMLKELYIIADEMKLDFVKSDYCAYRTMNDGKHFLIKRKNLYNEQLYNNVLKPSDYLEICIRDWYLWSGIYRREFLLKNKIDFNETPGAAFQDIGFVIKTLALSRRAMYIPKDGYRYCIDRTESSSNSQKMFSYMFSEYSGIIEWNNNCNFNNDICEKIIYARMAKSYMVAYRSENSSAENNDDYFYERKWTQNQLECAIAKGIISEENIPGDIWKNLISCIDDKNYKKKSQNQERIRNGIIGKPGEKKIVIFGCGDVGGRVNNSLKRYGYQVDLYIDNNKNLQGKTIDGVRIASPKECIGFGDEYAYIVANEAHSKEMIKELNEMGIDNNRIYEFNGMYGF